MKKKMVNGTMLSKVRVEQFFLLLEKYDSLNLQEGTISFPLEYYLGDSSIFLYKQVENKTYATKILILPVSVEDSDELSFTVFFKGKQITLESFVNDLITNFNAIELVEELDYNETKLKLSLE